MYCSTIWLHRTIGHVFTWLPSDRNELHCKVDYAHVCTSVQFSIEPLDSFRAISGHSFVFKCDDMRLVFQYKSLFHTLKFVNKSYNTKIGSLFGNQFLKRLFKKYKKACFHMHCIFFNKSRITAKFYTF